MNNPYTAMIIPGMISYMAEQPVVARREYTDDPMRSAGAKRFKKNKKKSRIAAASKRRNRKRT
ncbi:MAG: hypothetical protein J6A19_05070 [Oscillospiraceae bacterium]|nr:hypothetical protein [Oscillospiraceae bacterium]